MIAEFFVPLWCLSGHCGQIWLLATTQKNAKTARVQDLKAMIKWFVDNSCSDHSDRLLVFLMCVHGGRDFSPINAFFNFIYRILL